MKNLKFEYNCSRKSKDKSVYQTEEIVREVIARRIETIMGKRLGHMIREFREKQGRTIEEAARGLLSAAELSRVENGTKEIEYLIMEALFETYGKSLDKLEFV